MADQGCVVVKDIYCLVVGDAHDWMLKPEALGPPREGHDCGELQGASSTVALASRAGAM
jgi:hypothetical protein